MKRNIKLWQLMGFAVTSLTGTVLHFLYGLLGEAIWIAPFSSVNESTAEHMKILFWPMLVFAIAESLFFRGREDFFCIKLRGTSLGLALIPVLFYTYNGVIGASPAWLNIAIFFISCAVAYIYETQLLLSEEASCCSAKFPIAILALIALLFVLFTFVTPKLGIFRDPLTGSYGI